MYTEKQTGIMTDQFAPAFNTSNENFPSPFCQLRIDISEEILATLIPVMNEVHGTNHSYRFWKLLLSEYINAVISVKDVWEKKEMTNKPGLEAVNSHGIPTQTERFKRRLPSIVKHYKFWGAASQIKKLLVANNHLSFGMPAVASAKQDTGEPLPLYYPLYPGVGNKNKRRLVNGIAGKQSNLFKKNLITQLPALFVEHFNTEYNRFEVVGAKEKIFHIHGFPPFSSVMIVAKYAEHGAKIFCYQHGAYYGEFKGHNAWFHEGTIADEFRSWGWKIKANDVPWKAYRLEKFKQQYDKSLSQGDAFLMMSYSNIYNLNVDFYTKATHYFLDNIDREKYSYLLARPRPENKVVSHAGQLSFIKDKGVKIDSGLTSMAEMVKSAKIVVHFTLPATNFFECLYANHPVTGVLDNDEPTEIIKPYYNYLIEKGVIHRDFYSLVDHLNAIDVETWWKQLQAEEMFLEFKDKFLHKAS